MRSLLNILDVLFSVSRLILAGLLGWMLIIISPILITIFVIWNITDKYQRNYKIDRFICEKCGVLMGRGSFDLAKIENTKRWEEFNTKIAKSEQLDKVILADPNSTRSEKRRASSGGTMPYYGSPRTVDAVCICGAKYVYSDNRFQMLVENKDM